MSRRLGICVSYYCASPRSTAMLRVLIESIERHCAGEYEALVIADDCSPPDAANDAYLADLEAAGRAHVYRMGEPRAPSQRPKNAPPFPEGTKFNFGHSGGIMGGFHKLRQLGCTHGWVIDADCVVLDSGILSRAMALFDYERVAVVTDYFAGTPPKAGVDLVCDEVYQRVYRNGIEISATDKSEVNAHDSMHAVGFPNLFCAIVDLTVEEQFGAMRNTGWVNSKWGQRMFRKGYRCGYFPFFQGRHVFHLGLGFSSQKGGSGGLGNTNETVRYGGKTSGIYHAGFLQLHIPDAQYLDWIDGVGRAPLTERQAPKRSWFCDPPDVAMHGKQETHLRPFRAADLDDLCKMDADPETCRFMQWGPHGHDKSRAFLDRACQKRHEFFALEHKGRLAGLGEVRPLEGFDVAKDPGAESVGVAGLVYVIARPFWRQGLGTMLINSLVEIAYNQYDYGVLIVSIDTEHQASMKVLQSRHDFATDWHHLRTEPYDLKGQARQRAVYARYLPIVPPLPPEDPEACRLARETLLFDEWGLWR